MRFDHRQRHAEARRHVAADAEILGVQLARETRPDKLSRTMFGARCTKYQLEPAPAPSVDDHAVQRQPVRAGEGHGLGAGADDAGAHDLVGGLGGLAAAARAEMLDGLAHGREHRTRRVEGRAFAAAP